MCVSLTAVSETCGANPGGIKPFFHIIRKADLTSIPADTDLVVSADIVPVATKVFVKWDLDVNNPGKLDIETEGEGNNLSWKATYTVKVPRNIAAVSAALAKAIGQQLVIIAYDNAGNLRILGNLEKGCFMTCKGSTGETPTAFAGKEVVFSITGLTEEPYFYTGDVPIA
jgi:hypothetical protein